MDQGSRAGCIRRVTPAMKGCERKNLWFLKEAEITKHSEYMGNSLQSKLPMKIWNRYETQPHKWIILIIILIIIIILILIITSTALSTCQASSLRPPKQLSTLTLRCRLGRRCACTIIVIIENRMLIDFFASWSNIDEQGLPCSCFPSLVLTCSATMILTINLKIINITINHSQSCP